MIYNGNRHASPQSFAALWQINNWRNPFSRRSSLPRGQPENVVHSGMQPSRLNPRAGNKIFFHFQGLLLINPRNIISNIIMIFNINSTRGHTFGPLFSFHCPLFVTKSNNFEWKSSSFATRLNFFVYGHSANSVRHVSQSWSPIPGFG